MKKIAFFLCLTILFSCSQHKRNANAVFSDDAVDSAVKSDDTLKSIINENINRQPQVDSVFLGFTFGMTQKQAVMHFLQLSKEKKLSYNKTDGNYEYIFNLDVTKAKALIAPEFSDDKLYKLTLIISPADELGNDGMVYEQAAILYMKKYDGFTIFRQADLLNPAEKKYHWIKNNLHIFLHKTGEGTIVSYIDMPVDKLVDKKLKSDADSAKKQTQKDI